MLCPTCHTNRIHNGAHIRRCANATPEDRAYYVENYVWPRRDRKPDKPKDPQARKLMPVVLSQLESLIEMGDKGIRSSQVHGIAKKSLIQMRYAEERVVGGDKRTFVTPAGIERIRMERNRPRNQPVPKRRGAA